MKKVLGTTALAGAILVGGTFGTYSYFSDQMETSGSVEAGTLYFEREGFTDKNIFSGEKIQPGDVIAGELLHVKNDGNLPMWMRFGMEVDITPWHLQQDKADIPQEFVDANGLSEVTEENLREHYKMQLLVFPDENKAAVEALLAGFETKSDKEKYDILTGNDLLSLQLGDWNNENRIEQSGVFRSLDDLYSAPKVNGSSKWSYLKDFQATADRNRGLINQDGVLLMFNIMLDKKAGNTYQESLVTAKLHVQGIQQFERENGVPSTGSNADFDGKFDGTNEERFIWGFDFE